MNTLKMPGFTAESSLARSSKQYRVTSHLTSMALVQPQIGKIPKESLSNYTPNYASCKCLEVEYYRYENERTCTPNDQICTDEPAYTKVCGLQEIP
jgi:hypothetical protein